MFFFNSTISIILLIVFSIFILLSIVTILKKESKTLNKILWVLFVLVIPFFGSIIYFVNNFLNKA